MYYFCFEVKNAHSAAFKAVTASHEPTLIGGLEIEKAKTIAAGGRRGEEEEEGGVGGSRSRGKKRHEDRMAT